MAFSKVIYDGTTLMDVTDDTVTANKLLTGYQATGADGQKVIGTNQGPSWTFLASKDFTVNTSSTTATEVGTISCGSSAYTSGKILYIRVRDKAGARNGYFVGNDAFMFNYLAARGTTSTLSNSPRTVHRKNSDGTYTSVATSGTDGYGVYGKSISSNGTLTVGVRYNSSYSLTINGTYNVSVYSLEYVPNQGNPFNYSFS